jgi:hypothetical protein
MRNQIVLAAFSENSNTRITTLSTSRTKSVAIGAICGKENTRKYFG